MEQKLFATRDSKTELFAQPWPAANAADAQRMFMAGANNPQSLVGQFPEDFALYQMGTYDQKTGKITSLDNPVHICNARELIKKETSNVSPVTAH